MHPRFALGQTVITPGALASIPPSDVLSAVCRHHAGDWGDMDKEDWDANERALARGGRLFSSYHSQGCKFWIITEHDRSVTTILLPEEY